MSDKQCVKCGRTVDEAKAFCPYCSHSFVPEREGGASEFELTHNTATFTKSFFNEVLSDMELNISEAPDPPVRPESGPDRSAPSNVLKWGAALGVLLLLALIAVVILFLILR
ncbi:MAG: hypothetical protein ABI857_12400 [Acidobacteriota bacterium]